MSIKSRTSKVVAGLVGVAMAFSLVLGGSFTASAQTPTDIQAQITSLLATIASLQAQLAAVSGGTGTVCYSFSVNLKLGSRGADVMKLQKLLNSSADTQVAASGAGSPGNETSYFGPATYAAVIKFQNKFASEILTPVGLTKGTGFVGASTRAKLSVFGCTTTPTTPGGTTTPTTTGTNLSVSAPAQPASSLAPASAARVPFTKVTVTASSNGPVTVNGFTVERTGLAQDAVFSGVVLLDENGNQIGISKTLNSNHQTTVGEAVVVGAGQSRTFTVAGNMASSLVNYAGQVVGLSIVSVNTSAAVSGSLPITGAMHTINGSLSLGTATVAVSSFDPNTAITKEIGTTGYKFSGIRVTAGSVEKVRLSSIRFNQIGSASSNDLANVKVVVDGTSYDTIVSADGKYYTANFGSGIVIDKGFSKDLYIVADIAGSGAANRTVQFDIYKNTDIYLTGETYGYGIIPTAGTTAAAGTGSQFTTGTPFFDGSLVTISAGSATTITKSSLVPAQNIAVNVPNQPLGGFQTDIKGEAISVQSMVFNVASTTGSGYGLLTNVSILDENGSVVAGPVDGVYVSALLQTLTFTDTVTFPVGKHTYTLKGKVASTIGNGGTYIVSTTPSSQWTNITGQTTGNTISLAAFNSAISMNTMTVKSAALAIGVSTNPSAQTIVAGGQQVLFANYQFDASQSGEDVRFSSIPLTLTVASGAATDISACQLYDGTASSSPALNSGSNVVNPSAAGTNTFTLDSSLTIPKGTVKTVSLKCNVSSGATGSYRWGNTSGNISGLTVTGVTSSNSVTPTGTASLGQLMTVGSGSLVVSADSSSPSYTVASAGSTGVTLGVLKFRATNEDVVLQRVGLKLTNSASSSPADLVQVTLYYNGSPVGTATFTGSDRNATSTLNTPITLPANVDRLLTIKADLAEIGTSEPGTEGALIAVDIDTNGTNTQGVGGSSGTTVTASGSTSFDGVRMFNSFPTLAKDTLPSNGVADGRLLRFRVTADAKGDVGLSKFTLTFATTSANVSNVNVFGYTDSSYSQAITGVTTGGQVMASNVSPLTTGGSVEIFAQTTGAASTTIQVPAGSTRYFEVRGTVTGSATTYSVTTTLEGDSAYPSLATLMAKAASVDADANDDFIWSPNATTSSGVLANDWTNGYGLAGLPSNGIIETRSN